MRTGIRKRMRLFSREKRRYFLNEVIFVNR